MRVTNGTITPHPLSMRLAEIFLSHIPLPVLSLVVFGCGCVHADDLQHTLPAQCTVPRVSVGASRSRAQRDMRGAKQLRSHVQQSSVEQFVWSMYATSAAYLLMCVCVCVYCRSGRSQRSIGSRERRGERRGCVCARAILLTNAYCYLKQLQNRLREAARP